MTAAPPDAGVGFADIQRVLGVFAQGIAGRHMHLQELEARPSDGPAARVATDGTGIRLPHRIADFTSAAHNRGAYRTVVLHQIGYLEFGTFAFDLATARRLGLTIAVAPDGWIGPSRQISDLERFFAATADPALHRRVFAIVEDLRIDTAIRRHYPGARADLVRVLAHALASRPPLLDPTGAISPMELLVRYSLGADRGRLLAFDPTGFAEALLDVAATMESPDADVYASAAAALKICALISAHTVVRPPSQVVNVPIEEPLQGEGVPDKPGGALMDDERDGFAQPSDDEVDAPGVEFRGELLPDLVHRNRAAGQFGSLSKEPPKAVQMTASEGDPEAPEAKGAERKSGARKAAGRKADFDGQRSYLYDEWDYRQEQYRKTWCRVNERRSRGDDYAFIGGVRRRHAFLANQVKRRFTFIKPESFHRVHRTSDGDELEIDAVIEAVIDRKTGHATDEHLYVRRDRGLREVAAAFLLDMSASTSSPIVDPDAPKPVPSDDEDDPWGALSMAPPPTGRRVLDIAKDALALMCDALHTLGDAHAVYGFSGKGRENVEFHVAKEFSDAPSARTWASLAAMQPRSYTRMGPAIRHTTTKLAAQAARTKLMIIVSDGYPQDEDYGPDRGDNEYGLQDTAMALREAEQAGISTFCITIDPAGHDYLRRMCPEQHYIVIDDVNALPGELAKVYRALTAPSRVRTR